MKIGTKGTIVEKYDDHDLDVEFFDETGDMIQVTPINVDYLEVVWADPRNDEATSLEEGPTIELMLDYQAYPVWVKEEGDDFASPGAPKKGHASEEFLNLCDDIQKRYDNDLFIDNEKVFEFVGFKDKGESEKFIADLKRLVALSKELYWEDYKIVDKFDYKDYEVKD